MALAAIGNAAVSGNLETSIERRGAALRCSTETVAFIRHWGASCAVSEAISIRFGLPSGRTAALLPRSSFSLREKVARSAG
jgi:hypothetical protein